MSGYSFTIGDEYGIPLYSTDVLDVDTSVFVPGLLRDLVNSAAVDLGALQSSELEYAVRMSAPAQEADDYDFAIGDEYGFPLPIDELLTVTVETTADHDPPEWVTSYEPSLESQTLVGINISFRIDEIGAVYLAAYHRDATAPSAQNVKDGKQAGGVLNALAHNFITPVAANTTTQLSITGILYEPDGLTRIAEIDWYAVAQDDDGNLQLAPFSGGTVILDTAATFAGATDGAVNDDTHEVTLNWGAATDSVDPPEAMIYEGYYNIGAGWVLFYITEAGALSLTADPGIGGAADFRVVSVNTRNMRDSNAAVVPLTLRNGIYLIHLKPPIATNNTNSIIPSTDYNYYFFPGQTGKQVLDAMATGTSAGGETGTVTSGVDGSFDVYVNSNIEGELILFREGSAIPGRPEDSAFWQTVTPA